MKVEDKEKLNNPLKGWQILCSISSMVFHKVHWANLSFSLASGVGSLNMFYFRWWKKVEDALGVVDRDLGFSEVGGLWHQQGIWLYSASGWNSESWEHESFPVRGGQEDRGTAPGRAGGAGL